MKRQYIIILMLSFVLSAAAGTAVAAPAPLAGRILLQVESRGEAWYVRPASGKRYFLGRPLDAFNLMRKLSLGVSNADFARWQGKAPRSLGGRFLIKPQDLGKAYYVSPTTLGFYYLGRPLDAFNLMRGLGLGIANADLARIPIANDSATAPAPQGPSSQDAKSENDFPLGEMETAIFNLVNGERSANGLAPVAWNGKMAAVAREHSQNLADENQALINDSKICSYPFIHHEGVVFGLHHSERLNNRQVYDFSSSAENIALIPLIKSTSFFSAQSEPLPDCQAKLDGLNESYEAKIKTIADESETTAAVRQEIAARLAMLDKERTINITGTIWNSESSVERQAVDGWMNSPGHRINILNTDYTDAGLGIARVKDYLIITQVFSKKAECGYKTGPCCEKAGYYPYCYQPLQCADLICQ